MIDEDDYWHNKIDKNKFEARVGLFSIFCFVFLGMTGWFLLISVPLAFVFGFKTASLIAACIFLGLGFVADGFEFWYKYKNNYKMKSFALVDMLSWPGTWLKLYSLFIGLICIFV